jgi:hypothetical protein
MKRRGLKEQCIYTFQFANDQAVITNDREDIENMVKKLMKEYGNTGTNNKYPKNKVSMLWSKKSGRRKATKKSELVKNIYI